MRSAVAPLVRPLALLAALACLAALVSAAAAPSKGFADMRATTRSAHLVRAAANAPLAPFPNRVVTYNLANPLHRTPDEHAAFIAQYRPQVIGLQEGCVREVQAIRDKLDQLTGAHYHVVYGGWKDDATSAWRCHPYGGSVFGDFILSAAPVVNTVRHQYSIGGTEARGYIETTTEVDGMQMRVFNTHLAQPIKGNPQAEVRARQVNELVQEAQRYDPAIILGDFNAQPSQPEMQPIWNSFRDADPFCRLVPDGRCKATADAGPPRKKFDYIFLSRAFGDPPGNGVHGSPYSDHDLVHADISAPFPPTLPAGDTKPFDLPPTVHAGADHSGSEGSAVSLHGTASDDHGTPRVHWTYHAGANVDAGASCGFSNPAAVSSRFTCTDDGTFTVTLTASDGVHAPVSDNAVVRLRNVPPTLHLTGAKPWSVYRAGHAARVTATFTDPGSNDTHVCRMGWDDGGKADVSHPGNGSCGRMHTFAHAGMYSADLRVSDDDGGSDAAGTMLVVYDPTAGLAVGAGTVRSPAHALAMSGPGTATFVALAKYVGADDTSPTGALSYALPGTSLRLSATRLEWLVITPGGKAAVKGRAIVDGKGGYGFVAYLQSGAFRTVVWPTSQGSIPPASPWYDNRRGASYDLDGARPQPVSAGTTVVDHGWIPGAPSLDSDVLAAVQRYVGMMPKTLGIDLRL